MSEIRERPTRAVVLPAPEPEIYDAIFTRLRQEHQLWTRQRVHDRALIEYYKGAKE